MAQLLAAKSGLDEQKERPGEGIVANVPFRPLFRWKLYRTVVGSPDAALISTSYVERANLTMRMSMRRFTRLTNAFSKKVENLSHAVALHFMHYNFCRIHGTLRVTPAMEAGVSSTVWEVSDIVRLLERAEETGEIWSEGNPISN